MPSACTTCTATCRSGVGMVFCRLLQGVAGGEPAWSLADRSGGRNGCWFAPPRGVLAAHRGWFTTDKRGHSTGFRVARVQSRG